MQNFLFIRVDNKNIRVNYDEIIYVESVKNYIRIITIKKIYVLWKKLKQIEDVICPQHFCRIHRSYIISLKYLMGFDCSFVYLENKKNLPLSRQYKNSLETRITILCNNIKRKSKIAGINIDDSQKN
ncbi:MAG: LytTR family transcriptional regulator [Chitinophagaceae bacterium]|nr:LytTR family transcriptional regulator [Chitinophagaceae bacterium]